MDITATTAPKSDQQNYDDYIAGPKTVTVSEVKAGNAEQPVEIHLVEFPGRPFKPSKTVRRVLVAAWGPEASAYAGRRMTLFGDATVKWAGEPVGGIRVSHLSHIDKPLKLSLTTTRGKRSPFTVLPLEEAARPASDTPEPTAEEVATCTDRDTLLAMYRVSSPAMQKVIKARGEALTAAEDELPMGDAS